MKTIPVKDWEWFGHAAHFCCGRWCRFHMATKVGPWLISTVGLYVHPRNSEGNETNEGKWLSDHPNGEEIGCDRFYETMVFKAGAPCTSLECGCGLPGIGGSEVDSEGYKTAGEARKGHMALCLKYAKVKAP